MHRFHNQVPAREAPLPLYPLKTISEHFTPNNARLEAATPELHAMVACW